MGGEADNNLQNTTICYHCLATRQDPFLVTVLRVGEMDLGNLQLLLDTWIQGAARFCEVLKFRVLNHLFRGAIAAENVFLLRIKQFN